MKKTTIIILIVAAVLAASLCGAAIYIAGQRTANSEPLRIFLPEGTTFDALCDTLHTNGILQEGIKTQIFNFQFSILNSKVRPGSYVIESHMRELDLIRKLRNGQQDPLRLTIGKFRLPEQLNSYLNTKLMHNDFNVTLDSFHLILPDTYEFYWTVTPHQFMQRMEKEYNAFWSTRDLNDLNDPNDPNDTNDLKDLIILASIVEEETNHGPEKPMIASVYLNRLKRGMPLQADPTVKYAVGDFTLRRILNKHLEVESPFNTYLHTGLPPAPICLPSKATIDAVLNAPESNYLYFCASERLDGTHRFATTLAEHNRNAARYHAAIR